MKKLLRLYQTSTGSKRGNGSNGNRRYEEAKEIIYQSFENSIGISRDIMISRSRKWERVRCRIIAAYLARNLLGLSWKQCGAILDRDHSTAIHDHNSHEPCFEQDHKEYQLYYNVVLGEMLTLMDTKSFSIIN